MNERKKNIIILLILVIGGITSIVINPSYWLESVIFLVSVGGLFKAIQKVIS